MKLHHRCESPPFVKGHDRPRGARRSATQGPAEEGTTTVLHKGQGKSPETWKRSLLATSIRCLWEIKLGMMSISQEKKDVGETEAPLRKRTESGCAPLSEYMQFLSSAEVV
ncbi:hypothetical protein CesoFtcFv8_018428 [Champsocephalus esox]|uniref:Uncharacterized protein n=1 Tax=Champsocephalus esox TaxID=159716 RepID=A0AAN8BHL8_9TELE|nr:hypothetical protein CesoFtcFv8_018428 [Champsocephalus esox]